ncbi:MAG TPA: glycosyltransferase family 4 protein [Terriglobia bacterium]|jgi:glycosyltransferase involved in cell wall biosynthesis|nr:glycosyltransferase family 4 protein [Terriglobia bacterium]
MLDSLRILVVQNHYINFSGDDVVVANESSLLSAKGHEVSLWSVHNKDLTTLRSRIHTALSLAYSRQSKARLSRHIAEFRPDVMHCHNLFPQITLSAYDAAAEADIPIVQTLHDFRSVCCINGFLYRNGRICELCVAGSPYWGAWHRCYRDSWLGSFATAHALDRQRRAGRLQQRVGCFIALSEPSRRQHIAAGVPEERIVVKPNFTPDPGTPRACSRHGALFVGRLSPEKGLQTLVKAWEGIEFPLRILGGGPLRLSLSADLSRWISVLGHKPHAEVGPAMRQAQFLVMPSEYIEGFPMVIVEAFANGLPVIASRLGTMADIIEDGVTGLHFTAGDPDDLAAKVAWAITHCDRMAEMGSAARRVYETRYSEETNYQSLLTIYRDTISAGAESGKFAGKAASFQH